MDVSRKKNIAILITGSEVLDGRVHDTNSYFITNELVRIGATVNHVLSCDDELLSIQDCLKFLASRCDAIVMSGGLGPTTDDCTRDAVSVMTGRPLEKNDDAENWMRNLFAARKRSMNACNLRQAYFPADSFILPNPVGTARGFIVELKGSMSAVPVICLPGVPSELKAMMKESVLPWFLKKWPDALSEREAPPFLRVFGLPESEVGARIESLTLPAGIIVSYRANFPEVQVGFRGEKERLSDFRAKAKEAIGAEFVYSEDLRLDLPGTLHNLMIERGLTLAAAESCTGGLIQELFTARAGSSKWFMGGVVSYANSVKERLLNVQGLTLSMKGAVSGETAKEMASGVCAVTGADIGVSVTGIAGPDGGSAQKPVGTFFIGLSHKKGTDAYRFFHSGTRERVRLFAGWCAIDILRRFILDLPLPEVQ